jgi:vacuolar-type H+-ATPase subunit H
MIMGKKSTVEEIKEMVKEVSRNAEPVIDEARKKAEPLIKDVTKKAEPIYNDIREKAEPIYQDLREKAEPIYNDIKEKAAPAAKVVKTHSEKARKAAKTVSDDISLKAAKFSCKEEVFVQYSHHEIRTTDIIEKAKQDYVSKGNKPSSIREIQVYIKPSDNAAYYVVNHQETGKIGF